MPSTNNAVKSAMSPEERRKIIATAVAAGIGTAGIGALVKSIAERRKRKESQNVYESKDAIIVPISKRKFLDGVMSPDEQRQATTFKGDATTTPNAATDTAAASVAAEDIGAAKKRILGGRKLNFFGQKRAKDESAESVDGVAADGEKEVRKDGQEYNGGDKPTYLRDQSGRFVSQTDPVAVEQAEKNAFVESVADLFLHPVESGKRIGKAFVDRPVAYTAGALGSLYLATKITEYVNKVRKRKAEKELQSERDRYVKTLQDGEGGGGEKKAQADIRDWIGTGLGAAFVVPAALTSLITYRIIKNRERDKLAQKDKNNSVPRTPRIMYSVVGGDEYGQKSAESSEREITPEAALAVIAVKSAMYAAVERDSVALAGAEKQAQWIPYALAKGLEKGYSAYKDSKAFGTNPVSVGLADPMTADQAYKAILTGIKDPKNAQIFANMARGYIGNEGYDYKNDVGELAQRTLGEGDRAAFAAAMKDPATRAEVQSMMSQSRELQDALVGNLDNDAYADIWDPVKQDAINGYLTSKDGWGLDPNGILFKIVSWLANNTGIGNYFLKKNINERFSNARQAAANKAQEQNAQGGQQSQGVGSAAGRAQRDQIVSEKQTAANKAQKEQVENVGQIAQNLYNQAYSPLSWYQRYKPQPLPQPAQESQDWRIYARDPSLRPNRPGDPIPHPNWNDQVKKLRSIRPARTIDIHDQAYDDPD